MRNTKNMAQTERKECCHLIQNAWVEAHPFLAGRIVILPLGFRAIWTHSMPCSQELAWFLQRCCKSINTDQRCTCQIVFSLGWGGTWTLMSGKRYAGRNYHWSVCNSVFRSTPWSSLTHSFQTIRFPITVIWPNSSPPLPPIEVFLRLLLIKESRYFGTFVVVSEGPEFNWESFEPGT